MDKIEKVQELCNKLNEVEKIINKLKKSNEHDKISIEYECSSFEKRKDLLILNDSEVNKNILEYVLDVYLARKEEITNKLNNMIV